MLNFENGKIVITKEIRKKVVDLINENSYSGEEVEYQLPIYKKNFTKQKKAIYRI